MREQRHWLYYGVIICPFKVLAVLSFQDSLLAKSNQRSKTYNQSSTIKLVANPLFHTFTHCEEFLNSSLSLFFLISIYFFLNFNSSIINIVLILV